MSDRDIGPEDGSLEERLAAQTRADLASLTVEDLERGERIMVEVLEEVRLRHAAEAAGVTFLGKERLMRLRRANQRKRGLAADPADELTGAESAAACAAEVVHIAEADLERSRALLAPLHQETDARNAAIAAGDVIPLRTRGQQRRPGPDGPTDR